MVVTFSMRNYTQYNIYTIYSIQHNIYKMKISFSFPSSLCICNHAQALVFTSGLPNQITFHRIPRLLSCTPGLSIQIPYLISGFPAQTGYLHPLSLHPAQILNIWHFPLATTRIYYTIPNTSTIPTLSKKPQ